MNTEQKFIEELRVYLQPITVKNFSDKYDGMMDIVIKYNQNGLGRAKILELLNLVSCDEGLNEAQEEIVSDTYCRITGYASFPRTVDLRD
jgi:hypothetical protein